MSDYVELDLATAVNLNGMVYDGTNISVASGNYYADFAFPTLILQPGVTYELEITGASATGVYSQLETSEYGYSNSYWYTLGYGETRGLNTMYVGPGVEQFDAALEAGENHIVFDIFDASASISRIRYRQVAAAYANLGKSALLTDVVADNTTPGEEYYDAWYGTGAVVYPGILLSAWCFNGQSPISFNARAARWKLDVDGRPAVDLGAEFIGPLASTYPAGYAGAGVGPYESYREVGQMHSLGNGWVFLQFNELYDAYPTLGQLLHVDETTLQVTLGARIDDPDGHRWPQGWSDPPTVGEGRIAFSGRYVNDFNATSDRYWISFDTTSANPTYTTYFPDEAYPSAVDYMAWVDVGSYWIGLGRIVGPGSSSSTDRIQVITFPNLDGHPDMSSPTVRWDAARGQGWDIDSTHAVLMGGGLVYILEVDYLTTGTQSGGGGYQVRIRVLDTATWTMSAGVLAGTTYQSSQGGLSDYVTLAKVDDTTAVYSRATVTSYAAGNEYGGFIGYFDGTRLTQEEDIFPWRENPLANSVDGFYNWEGYDLGDGRTMAMAIINDVDTSFSLPKKFNAPIVVPGGTPPPPVYQITNAISLLRRTFT